MSNCITNMYTSHLLYHKYVYIASPVHHIYMQCIHICDTVTMYTLCIHRISCSPNGEQEMRCIHICDTVTQIFVFCKLEKNVFCHRNILFIFVIYQNL